MGPRPARLRKTTVIIRLRGRSVAESRRRLTSICARLSVLWRFINGANCSLTLKQKSLRLTKLSTQNGVFTYTLVMITLGLAVSRILECLPL
jgi:hypothetical protein